MLLPPPYRVADIPSVPRVKNDHRYNISKLNGESWYPCFIENPELKTRTTQVQGGPLALCPLRFGPPVSLCFRHLICFEMSFLLGIEEWRKGHNIENVHVCFGLLLMKNAPSFFFFQKKKQIFCTFQIDTHHRLLTPIDVSQPRLTLIPSVCKHFHNENGLVRRNSLPLKRWLALAWATRSRPR